jgi:3-phenylpropionate/trans-cinnamate dioxygenase ferredoxin reductase component
MEVTDMANDPVTVVGNGVAGYACAARLASAGVPVELIGPGLPCDRPPLSKRALARGRLPYLTDALALEAAGIVHVDGRVDALDLRRRALTVRGRDGGPAGERPFARLVWATGVAIARPPVPGIEATDQNVDAASTEALLPRLAEPGRRVVVIGAGLIGCETAATLARSHRVTLLERADEPLGRQHPDIVDAAGRVLAGLGITFRGGCAVTAIERARAGRIVHTATHGDIAADVVIAVAGVRATLPPALGGGLDVDTDERLRVLGADRVWACGDVAAFPHPRFGRIAVPHWDNARASGVHAAESVLGADGAYDRDPYWFSDIGPLRIQQVGFAPAACEWVRRDDLHVGHDDRGRPACVVLLGAPTRLNDARRMLAA